MWNNRKQQSESVAVQSHTGWESTASSQNSSFHLQGFEGLEGRGGRPFPLQELNNLQPVRNAFVSGSSQFSKTTFTFVDL